MGTYNVYYPNWWSIEGFNQIKLDGDTAEDACHSIDPSDDKGRVFMFPSVCAFITQFLLCSHNRKNMNRDEGQCHL